MREHLTSNTLRWFKSRRRNVQSRLQVLPAGVTAATVLIMHEGPVFMSAFHLPGWNTSRERERMEEKPCTGRTHGLHLKSAGVMSSDQFDDSSNVK